MGSYMHSSRAGDVKPQRTPRLAPDWDPHSSSLTPAEGFLLSRIDGKTSWDVLRQIGGLPPEEIDRSLERWAKEGLIGVEAAVPAEPRAETRDRDAADARLDPALDDVREARQPGLEIGPGNQSGDDDEAVLPVALEHLVADGVAHDVFSVLSL